MTEDMIKEFITAVMNDVEVDGTGMEIAIDKITKMVIDERTAAFDRGYAQADDDNAYDAVGPCMGPCCGGDI